MGMVGQQGVDSVALCSGICMRRNRASVARPRCQCEHTRSTPLDSTAPGSTYEIRQGCGHPTAAWRKSSRPDHRGPYAAQGYQGISLLEERRSGLYYGTVIGAHQPEREWVWSTIIGLTVWVSDFRGYGTSLYTHRNGVYAIPRYNVTVLFSEPQNSSCRGLRGLPLELFDPRILCSYPPKYMGGKRRCERRGSVGVVYAATSETSAASRSEYL